MLDAGTPEGRKLKLVVFNIQPDIWLFRCMFLIAAPDAHLTAGGC